MAAPIPRDPTSREARFLPLVGPLLVVYLVIELLATRAELDGVSVALLVVAAIGALSPRWFLRRTELRPSKGLTWGDEPPADGDGRRRLSWIGICAAVIAVARAASTSAGGGSGDAVLEIASGVAAPWLAWLVLDAAFVTPDPMDPARPGQRTPWFAALRAVLIGSAVALSIMEVLRSGALLEAPGGELVIVPHTAGWWTATFSFLCGLGALGARTARRHVGSDPDALAANAWALLGIALAELSAIASVLLAVIGDPVDARPSEQSPVVRGLAAFGLAALVLGHLAMAHPGRPVRAARHLRTLVTALVALAFAGLLGVWLRGFDRTWVHTAVRVIGIVLASGAAYGGLRAVVDRAFAPNQGRLLEAIAEIRGELARARTIEDLTQRVLRPLRRASRHLQAQPLLYVLEPATELSIDAAGLPHREARALSPAILDRLVARSGEVLVTAPLVAQMVRRPDTHTLAETLLRLDALCVVPLRTDDLEGALVVPRGTRWQDVTLEEIAELELLGVELGAFVGMWAAEARAHERRSAAQAEIHRLEERVAHLEDELADRGAAPPLEPDAPDVAYSPTLRGALRELDAASDRDTPLLLVCESGTPVERWLRRLHARGPRRDQPLLVVPCAELADASLRERVLGNAERPGALREAGRGIVVLRDALALPPSLQAELAESIATRTVQQGSETHLLQARLVFTSTLPLAAAETPFDPELAKRLVAQTIELPPLAERPEDIASLVLLTLARACRRDGRPVVGIEDDALAFLRSHALGEGETGLQRAVEQAARVARPPRVRREDVEHALRATLDREGKVDPLEGTLADVEQRVLLRALERAEGNRTEAARLLGLKRSTFVDKLRRLGIDDTAPPTS